MNYTGFLNCRNVFRNEHVACVWCSVARTVIKRNVAGGACGVPWAWHSVVIGTTCDSFLIRNARYRPIMDNSWENRKPKIHVSFSPSFHFLSLFPFLLNSFWVTELVFLTNFMQIFSHILLVNYTMWLKNSSNKSFRIFFFNLTRIYTNEYGISYFSILNHWTVTSPILGYKSN